MYRILRDDIISMTCGKNVDNLVQLNAHSKFMRNTRSSKQNFYAKKKKKVAVESFNVIKMHENYCQVDVPDNFNLINLNYFQACNKYRLDRSLGYDKLIVPYNNRKKKYSA